MKYTEKIKEIVSEIYDILFFFLFLKFFYKGTNQDGRSLTSRDCSSQGRRGELEGATLSDKVWLLTEQKIPHWWKHTGRQRDSRGRHSGSAST